jgi:hypothetical protein
MTATPLLEAAWIPAWRELDQSLEVGLRDQFWFFKQAAGGESPTGADLVFFNRLVAEGDSEIRLATVVAIEHPELGPLQRIDTGGLDYLFVCPDGREIVVNAEEEPGMCFSPGCQCSDWAVRVSLSDVSEPLKETI